MHIVLNSIPFTPSRMKELVLWEFRAKNIVFDVDWTLIGRNLDLHSWVVRPGAVESLRALHESGVEVFLWSGGGKEHCEEVRDFLELQDVIQGCWRKPEFPMTKESAIERLGFVPAVTVDDDTHERIDGIDFLEVKGFTGMDDVLE